MLRNWCYFEKINPKGDCANLTLSGGPTKHIYIINERALIAAIKLASFFFIFVSKQLLLVTSTSSTLFLHTQKKKKRKKKKKTDSTAHDGFVFHFHGSSSSSSSLPSVCHSRRYHSLSFRFSVCFLRKLIGKLYEIRINHYSFFFVGFWIRINEIRLLTGLSNKLIIYGFRI